MHIEVAIMIAVASAAVDATAIEIEHCTHYISASEK
jgi:hypothetical protein